MIQQKNKNDKVYIEQLAIEITRNCNMQCAHCVRGDAQNRSLNIAKLGTFLDSVAAIGDLALTGGEPSLNTIGINHLLELLKEKHIPVDGFYCVTNGKHVSDDFIMAMVNFYCYVLDCGGDAEMCGLALSRDNFHEPIGEWNVKKLRALSFFREEDKKWDFSKRGGLIDLGRAKDLTNVEKRKITRCAPNVEIVNAEQGEFVVSDEVITYTVDGDILVGCDYEYAETDTLKFASWDNFLEQVRKAATDPSFVMPCA